MKVFLTACLATIMILTMPLGAAADDSAAQSVAVSLDGENFSSSPTGVVFSPGYRIVPGDSIAAPVWIRNDGPTTARLHVEFSPSQVTDPDFARELTIQPERLGVPGDWWGSSIQDADVCTVLVNNVVLDPGEIIDFDLTATLGNLDGLDGQRGSALVEFRAVLTDAAVPPPSDLRICGMTQPTPTPTPVDPTEPGPSPEPTLTAAPEPDGGLSITGASVTLVAVAAGVLALGGIVFVIIGWRRRGDE